MHNKPLAEETLREFSLGSFFGPDGIQIYFFIFSIYLYHPDAKFQLIFIFCILILYVSGVFH